MLYMTNTTEDRRHPTAAAEAEEGNTTTTETRIDELQNGDIVWTHGLRVRVSDRKVRPHQLNGETAVHFSGQVLNPEVFEDEQMRRLFGGLVDFDDPHWSIQSVSWLLWNREV